MKKNDLTGKRFGILTVISSAEKRSGNTAWNCICDCGKKTISLTYNLTSGKSKSCGCVRGKKAGILMRTHGLSNTRLYRIYKGMRQRCLNENTPAFKYYGGRGIVICEEWKNDFNSFYKWANMNGYNYNLTIDRIDPNANYCPSNCRWETPIKQQNNKLNSMFLIINGKKNTIAEWAEIKRINKQTLYSKFYRLMEQLEIGNENTITFEIKELGYAKTEISKQHPILF